jgi:hypothetical protein
MNSTNESATEGTAQLPDFTDAHLKRAMFRAMRLVAILSVALASVLLLVAGWQTALLLLIGAAISIASLWEWQRLLALILAKLDNQKTVGGAHVVLGFFLRLLVAAAVLYGSLRFLHGSVYALLGGLVLAAGALSVEAARLIRS